MYAVVLVCIAVPSIQVLANPSTQVNINVAVVTGGARGIGNAIVDNLLKNGAKIVIIVDINKPRGMQAERDLNCKYGANRTIFMYGDITKDLKRLSRLIFKTFGCIDLLVNNAGVLDEKNPKKMMITNALGTVLWTQTFFECMRKDTGGKGGTIINIASVSAYYRDPFIYFYKATKFAIVGITVGMGHEYNYMTSGVRIFAICPGLTRTDMTNRQMTVDEQVDIFNKFRAVALWQEPDAVGKAAVILYRTAITATIYTVEGGQPPVVSPDGFNITLDFLNSLK